MSSELNPTRDRILKAAWTLLEDGASQVRMSDIAKAAGISRQALYLHFPNRADLLVATTRHIDAVNRVDALLAPSREARSGEERLETFITAWASHLPNIQGVARALIAMQESDVEARRAWEDRMAALREGCAAAVAALAQDGRLDPGHSQASATDWLMMLLAVPNWTFLTRDCGWNSEQYRQHVIEAARRSLMTR